MQIIYILQHIAHDERPGLARGQLSGPFTGQAASSSADAGALPRLARRRRLARARISEEEVGKIYLLSLKTELFE